MNSFNRLLSLYIVLFNRKILYDYNEKCQKFVFYEKMRIFVIQKKPNKRLQL